jgi:biopolymer transport protein ExbB
MFEGKTLLEIIQLGGFTMYILIACSVLSLAVFLERMLNYRRKSLDRIEFMNTVREQLNQDQLSKAVKFCEESRAPIAAVVLAALKKAGHQEKFIANAAERAILLETSKLERFTSIVGTIGNVAVYIGLFGTVLGIVRSFHSVAQVGSGGIAVVIGGVAEALICTAAGLSVAIPAVVVYNYFTRRVDGFVVDMEYCSSEVLDLLMEREKT